MYRQGHRQPIAPPCEAVCLLLNFMRKPSTTQALAAVPRAHCAAWRQAHTLSLPGGVFQAASSQQHCQPLLGNMQGCHAAGGRQADTVTCTLRGLTLSTVYPVSADLYVTRCTTPRRAAGAPAGWRPPAADGPGRPACTPAPAWAPAAAAAGWSPSGRGLLAERCGWGCLGAAVALCCSSACRRGLPDLPCSRPEACAAGLSDLCQLPCEPIRCCCASAGALSARPLAAATVWPCRCTCVAAGTSCSACCLRWVSRWGRLAWASEALCRARCCWAGVPARHSTGALPDVLA